METVFIFGVIFLGAVILLPIISLVKLSVINKKITGIEEAIKRLQPQEKTVINEVHNEEPIKEEVIEEEPDIIPTYIPEAVPPPFPVMQEVYNESVMSEPEETDSEPETVLTEESKKTGAFALENLLSKIGIVTLVLGIGFFVKYAIDKDWINEIGRVAIGVITGGAIIAIAHKLKEKYNVFSAILTGGGISVLYITITLAFREYHLFNQTFAFIILIAITLFSVLLSLLYDRKELALFSLLGGYASPLMISTGSGNYVVLFSFLFILNAGMLIISMRKRWNIIGIVSFICTLLFYWGWLLLKFDDQYIGAITFGILFFVQFYLLVLFDHFLSGKNISAFQAILILVNNLSLFAASIYVIREAGYGVEGIITILMAIINALVMIVLFKRSNIDKRLIYLIIAIVLSFASLAVPVQLKGHVITLFWAAEMVILLWLWLKSEIKVFRTGFILISVLTLISYFMDVEHHYGSSESLPVIFNRIFITGLVVIAALVACRFLLIRHKQSAKVVSDWHTFTTFLTVILVSMAYLVPFFEIVSQVSHSFLSKIDSFSTMLIALYTSLYAAVISLVYRKYIRTSPSALYALIGLVVVFAIVALPAIIYARESIFVEEYSSALFLIHYLSLPCIAFILYTIVKNIHIIPSQTATTFSWILVALSVAILSVELDSTIIQIAGTATNYSDLLYDVHTFGYPILWGILAMILMIWGLKCKAVILRKISLVFFAFIILKFYISDIWLMSPTGRIISFVALGIILLSVSFLIQKIKMLIKDDNDESEKE
ncbi:DUF2339 domain-containing protein [Bacteroides sp. 224]|uniref:DUF2339 domain-containing protein n=1 Tax=Bacteroides sp. 224 TaxID=2302936 RepID=UPI0013D820A9|nr:DUF2339 domain-containing protein [Bacteroides sp. 224]NDV66888.1 DUF2339 domain-containing protein [Bacteroides sp. 224]